jgi:hypothetical protein
VLFCLLPWHGRSDTTEGKISLSVNISEINNHIPVSEAVIFWCECIWQWLTHYEWDVVDYHSLSRFTTDTCLGGTVHKLLKRSINWAVEGLQLERGLRWKWHCTPYSSARSRNFMSRRDWRLSSRINTGSSFVTLVCFMKCCVSNTKLSPVIHPDLFSDPALPSGPFAVK